MLYPVTWIEERLSSLSHGSRGGSGVHAALWRGLKSDDGLGREPRLHVPVPDMFLSPDAGSDPVTLTWCLVHVGSTRELNGFSVHPNG